MSNYHIDNALAGTQQVMTGTYKTLLETLAQTAGIKRNKLWGFNIGPSAAPASSDTNLEGDISRATATCTGTALPANAMDPADGAATSASKANATAEGTVTATSSVWYGAMNQRATFAWQTNDQSQMLIGPATNNAGLVMRSRSAGYTGTVGAGWYWRE